MSDRPYTRRTSRSVRFDPYYKLEWFDSTLMVWRPVQKAYASVEDAARVARTADRQWRLMEVTTHGYAPVPLPQ